MDEFTFADAVGGDTKEPAMVGFTRRKDAGSKRESNENEPLAGPRVKRKVHLTIR